MASLLMMTALAGCGEAADTPHEAVPQLPAVLVWHDEPPIGSELNHRLVRASHEVAVKLEPRWGKLQPRIHTVSPEDRDRLPEELRKAMPQGWRAEPVDGIVLKGARLHAYSSGDRFFGALEVDPVPGSAIPVVILRNRALLDATPDTKG